MYQRNGKRKAQASATWTRARKRKTQKVFAPRLSNGWSRKARGELSPPVIRRKMRRLSVEKWLRKELRANRKLMLGVFRFGLGVLVAFSTALYYVRRDVANNLAAHNALPANGTVPPMRYFIGTTVLFVIACIICAMNRYLIQRQVGYRKQLIDMHPSYSGIVETSTGGRINRYHYWLFFAFPLIDVVLFFYSRLASSVTIPW